MAGSVIQNPFSSVPAANPRGGQSQPQPIANDDPKNQNKNNSGVIPGNEEIIDDPTKASKGDDPMLDFSKLWENEPIDPKNPPQPEETNFLPKIDPAKLGEIVGKMDFSKYATPEELTAITAGGEGATKAHFSVLNKTLRQALLTSFNVSHKLVESGLTNAEGRFLRKVPGHVKDIIVESDLTAGDPIMSNPAFAPIIESTRQRFQEKFPKATPAQISNAVKKYIQNFVETATKKSATVETDNATKLNKGATDADWEKWIEPELENALQP